MLKKDNALLGLAIALLTPIMMFIPIYFLDKYLAESRGVPYVIKDETKFVMSIFFNLIFFRLYMINWKLDKTGRGILGGTFILAMVYLVLFHVMDKKTIF
jgi:hypothetical protein